MNRSDSEEMAGRLLQAGCEEAETLESADLIVINTCAIREGAEQKVIGRMGQLARLKAANPGLRVVLTGCSVREPDRAGLRRRYPAVDLFLRPDEEPELVDRLGLASAQAPAGAVGAMGAVGATTVVGHTTVGVADHLAGTRARAVGEGSVARGSAIAAWLPIIYGCDKTCTYCIVPFSRGPERSRPFDDIVDEARALAAAGYREVTLLGQNVNSYGHDLAPEPRFGHVDAERWAGRRLDLARTAGPGRADPGHRRPAHERRQAGDRAPALRDVAPVGPVRSPDRRDGRLRFGLRAPPPAGPVRRRRGPASDGPPVHDRALPRAPRPDPRGRPGHHRLDRHHRRVLRRDRGPVRGDAGAARDRPLRPGLRGRLLAAARARPATHLADDVPADVKRRRLNELLALQEGIGLERNEAWLGREAAVLVDAIVPPRGHDHDDAPDGIAAPTVPSLSGRTRGNKLVHLAGPTELVGREVDGPDRARRPVRAPGRARRGVTTAPPLIVIAGPTATGKTALAIDLAEALRATGRTPRSSRPTRARSSAASTSARPR